MQIHHYSPVTGEYLGAGIAHESPLEPGVFLLPAHSTTTAPPEPGANQAAVFADGAWTLVPDHRGQRWYQPDGSEVNIDQVNVVPHRSWKQKPPRPNAKQRREALANEARMALVRTDSVALRCFKAGVAFPAAWQKYTVALRNIVNGTDTESTGLPAQPNFPKGS